MIIAARDGNTAGEYRPFTDIGAIAHFLHSIPVGADATIDKFVRMDGQPETVQVLQIKIAKAKPCGSKFRTRATNTGGLTVWRTA